ncbi:MAG: hypothetical protein LUH50_10220 [Bacteroides intestinalis]|nr:hypothetical protein [Bacteroides intestinalis]
MLSYNILVAIQLLHVLQKSEKRALSITELKQECLYHDSGSTTGRIVRILCKEGWVESNCKYKYRLIADLPQKSLLDLVMIIDNRVQMYGTMGYELWGMTAQRELLHAIEMNERLRRDFITRLENINLSELFAQENITEIKMETPMKK